MMFDLLGLFNFSSPPLEIFFRGSVIYWFLFLIFRFILRRDVGSMGIGDFLFVVIVADASQNAMSGDAKNVADGMLLVGTLVFWNFLLDYLSYRFPLVRQFAEASIIPLVKNGRLQWRNLRREFITKDDLLSKLREEGMDDFSQVKEMLLESDGSISVVRKNG
ncbi:MAG: DUF421 domain-containing protein [Methylophilaceae bacterium]|uniref:DUF421 domain-containing protein n=1 Tax=Methylovorus sp. MM2 TaxID=1848038 RepID=UPI0007DEA957|nr:YetF domain-containing protein [Methylovorus sp. MM2]OAM51505.1 hypothetical protein A7981_08420 [Methylovorus sp. MM2]